MIGFLCCGPLCPGSPGCPGTPEIQSYTSSNVHLWPEIAGGIFGLVGGIVLVIKFAEKISPMFAADIKREFDGLYVYTLEFIHDLYLGSMAVKKYFIDAHRRLNG